MRASEQMLADRYLILERVASGATADVYRARDTVLGRDVAIKVFRLTDALAAAETFARESRLASSLTHPHIVTTYDAIATGDGPALVMQFVEGESLAQALRRGPLTAGAAMRIARDVAAALAVAHAQGIVHRDVKPANVLLDRDGTALVTDFGIATAAQATQATIAHDGSFVGSIAYAAPEQLLGTGVTPASNMYGLGVMLYEMLSGRLPHAAPDGLSGAVARATQPSPTASEMPAEIPASLAPVVARLLARNPSERPTAQTFLDTAPPSHGGPSHEGPTIVTPVPTGVRQIRDERLARSLAVLAVSAALAISLVVAGSRREAAPVHPAARPIAHAAPRVATTPAVTDAVTVPALIGLRIERAGLLLRASHLRAYVAPAVSAARCSRSNPLRARTSGAATSCASSSPCRRRAAAAATAATKLRSHGCR